MSVVGHKFGFCVLVALYLVASVTAQERPPVSHASGATFPEKVYEKWISTYKGESGKLVQYNFTGSGDGRAQIINQTVDFAGSDTPLSDAEYAAAPDLQVKFCN
jgi:phosphate transport system substrate-binding protein